jgi:F420-non-reducing hydrogenase iron-sulfur subunit
MTALAAAPVERNAQTAAPRILVFSTNNISDQGIDLAGSAHLHY